MSGVVGTIGAMDGVLRVRMSLDEIERMRSEARLEGVTLSRWVRERLRRAPVSMLVVYRTREPARIKLRKV